MNILYGFLIALIVYPSVGTLLFALMENLKTSTKVKISILTFGHPFLTAAIIWFACSPFNSQIAETGVLVVAGSLLRIPFSDRKYLSRVVKESDAVIIEYYSELLKLKTVAWRASEFTDSTQSLSRTLLNKPCELTVPVSNETFKFIILDKTTKVSL